MRAALDGMIFVPDGRPVEEAMARTTHLGIGAHQDDLEIMAYAGIEACYGREDAWFGGVTVTDGGGCARSGPFRDYTDAEMRAARWEEQNEAARIGRYAFQAQLGWTSAGVKDPGAAGGVVEVLAEILRGARPQTLYLHSPFDRHDTHIAVLRRCLEALAKLEPGERPATILGCEVWRDLDWLDGPPKVALPVGCLAELERELIEVFQTQIAGGKNYTAAVLGRRRAHATYHRSHEVDGPLPGLIFAVDLTAFAGLEAAGQANWLEGPLVRLRDDVLGRWDKFAGAARG